jgi:hypothetical protein
LPTISSGPKPNSRRTPAARCDAAHQEIQAAEQTLRLDGPSKGVFLFRQRQLLLDGEGEVATHPTLVAQLWTKEHQ